MLKIGQNKMYFDCDDDFFVYAVKPDILIKSHDDPNGGQCYYTDFDFTDVYNKAVNDGIVFVIKDPNSSICKHQAISYRTITKPVQNLEPYNNWFENRKLWKK